MTDVNFSKKMVDGVIVDMTPEEITDREAEVAQIKQELAATQYIRDRESAYPTIAEQLDMQYWDSVNGTTTWAAAIQAVKDANPKPE